MLTKPVRIAIVVLLCVAGGLRLYGGSDSGWFYVAAGCLLLIGLRRHGSVWLAYRAVTRGDTARAATLLGQIGNPSRLSGQALAYYHWVAGNVASSQSRPQEAYDHLTAALEGGLRTPHIQAVTHCGLAEAALSLGHKDLAVEHLSKARALPFRGSLLPFIASLEERMGEKA